MIHLKSITYNKPAAKRDLFPYSVRIINSLTTLELTTDITFLIGENGSGKSTLLEAIACAAGSIAVGSADVDRDSTLGEIRALAKHLKLVWNKKTRRGFFMRAEDFFGFAKRMIQVRDEMKADLESIEEEYKDRSAYAKGLAMSPLFRELGEMQRAYGKDLDSYSHGESFFTLFKSRFVPGGLYLLDEPEVPLSPLKQLAFIRMLKQMVDQNSQFIIATHSPILMAYPGAAIFTCDEAALKPIRYEDTEHVSITRSFLNNPEQYLKHLLE